MSSPVIDQQQQKQKQYLIQQLLAPYKEKYLEMKKQMNEQEKTQISSKQLLQKTKLEIQIEKNFKKNPKQIEIINKKKKKPIIVKEIKTIAECLKQNLTEVLNISNIDMNDETIVIFVQGLKNNLSIKTLILSFNNISDFGIITIICFIINNNINIIHLDISDNLFHDIHIIQFLIIDLLNRNKNIKTLNVNNNKFNSDTFAIALSNSNELNNHPSLTNLYCKYNTIGQIGIYKLAEMILKNPNIQDFDIFENYSNVTYDTFKLLCQIWAKKLISYINIYSYDFISNISISNLISALNTNKLITKVRLANIRIKDPQIFTYFCNSIYSLLRNNNHLLEFEITVNDIDNNNNNSLCYIGEGLKYNNTLLKLNISGIKTINDNDILNIANGIKQNKTLLELRFLNTTLKEDHFKLICDALEENKTIINLYLAISINFINYSIRINTYLARNRLLRDNCEWSPNNHNDFGNKCNNAIMTILLCNNRYKNRKLTPDVLNYTFSFFQRQLFY